MAVTGNATVGGNATITGNLVVNGTTTTVSSTTVEVADKNIELGKVSSPSDTTADGGGITLDAGSDGDKTWNWVNSTDAWTSSEHIDLASGKVLKINGTQVLDGTNYTGNAATATKFASTVNINGVAFDGSSAITVTAAAGTLTGATLASGVTASSLTSVGTLTGLTSTGDINLNAQADLRFKDADSSHYVALQSPASIASSFTLTLPSADAAVSGYVLASDGAGTLSWVDPGSTSSPTFTGDVSLTNDGALVGFSNLNATYTGNAKTLTVTVASKTAAHRYYGSGSSSGYKIDGKESPFLTLTPGRTYKFDQAHSSNSGHPLVFYELATGTAYTTGVTTNGTPGSSGAYTQIVVSDTTPQVLHYQCSNHSYMGNAVQTNSNVAYRSRSVEVTAQNSVAATVYPLFAGNGATATGYLTPATDTGFTYNSLSGDLTATKFTGSGASLTNLNATNLASGTVDVARLGSGASNTKFLRGDNTWQPISATPEGTAILSTGISSTNYYLRPDGSGSCSWEVVPFMPLAGGTFTGDVTFFGGSTNVHIVFDASDDALEFSDNTKATFGTGTDLTISSDGQQGVFDGDIQITGQGQNVLWDKSANTLWFKTNTAGGPSAKAWFGDGTSYGNLEIAKESSYAIVNARNVPLYVQSVEQDVILGSGKDILFYNTTGTTNYWIKCNENSGTNQNVELLYGQGGSGTRLETTSAGVTITGAITTTGNADITGTLEAGTIQLGNSEKILLGTSPRYEIYNDSANLIIDQTNSSGTTYIRAKQNGSIIFDASDTGNQVAAKFLWSNDSTPVSSAELYQGGTKRFETTSTGCAVTGALTISGDLTVNGTTTTIDSTTLQVEDKNIEIGKVSTPTDSTADGGGLTLLGATNKTFNWVNSTDAWTSSEHIQVASGKTFIGNGSTLTALNASNLASGTVATARLGSGTASSSNFLRGDNSWQAIDLTNLSANSLTSGTVPDARFPSTLPAVSGANLTSLNASNISSGTIAAARVPTLNQNTTGSAGSFTAGSASNLNSGTLPDARFPATLPAISGANLSSVNAASVGSATVGNILNKQSTSYYRASTWVEFYNTTSGLYWNSGSANGWHINPTGADYLRIRSGSSSQTGLDMQTNGTTRGFLYANNSNQIGLLNTSQAWILRCDNSLNTTFFGAVYPYADNNYSLGTSSYRWNQVHATTFHGSGANLTNLPASAPSFTTLFKYQDCC